MLPMDCWKLAALQEFPQSKRNLVMDKVRSGTTMFFFDKPKDKFMIA